MGAAARAFSTSRCDLASRSCSALGLSTDAVDRSTTCSTPALTACSTKASMLEDAA
jgi:hypothetical protein